METIKEKTKNILVCMYIAKFRGKKISKNQQILRKINIKTGKMSRKLATVGKNKKKCRKIGKW